ncbi:MAG TPA: energy transducer TonB [Longimicrobiales bacterium]|nr:energy transducer TonB [Longimicrobiales bacterium]
MDERTKAVHETANDRFKRGFGDWFWGALIVATLLHAGLFLISPTFGTEDYSFATDELESIELPDEIEIPPPPEAIQRPATPVIAEANIEEDITIAPTTFEENPIDNLPPPPGDDGDLSAAPTFTPMTVRPQYRNLREIQQALMRYYPPLLRDAGIGGTVKVWFFIDENGKVQNTRLFQSSGYDAFDQAALKVAELAEFSPAYNRDKKVPVWIALDITFEVQQ